MGIFGDALWSGVQLGSTCSIENRGSIVEQKLARVLHLSNATLGQPMNQPRNRVGSSWRVARLGRLSTRSLTLQTPRGSANRGPRHLTRQAAWSDEVERTQPDRRESGVHGSLLRWSREDRDDQGDRIGKPVGSLGRRLGRRAGTHMSTRRAGIAVTRCRLQGPGGEPSPWKERVLGCWKQRLGTTDPVAEQRLEGEGRSARRVSARLIERRNTKKATVAETRNGCNRGDFFEGCERRIGNARLWTTQDWPSGRFAVPASQLKRCEPCLALGCNTPRARPMEQTAGVVKNHESGTRRRVGLRSAEEPRQRDSGGDMVGYVGRRAPQMNSKRGGLAERHVPGAIGRSEGEGKTTRVASVVHFEWPHEATERRTSPEGPASNGQRPRGMQRTPK